MLAAITAGLAFAPAAEAAVHVPGRPNHDDVAYVVGGRGPNHIYVSDLQGRHPQVLVKGRDPAWSPDGQWISYRTGNPDRPGGNATRIHLIRGDGSRSRLLKLHLGAGEASGEAGPAEWSPDGRWLLFDTLGGIYVVRPNGNDLPKVSEFPGRHLACYDLEPSWSPDGTAFVFAVLCDGGDLGIWRVKLDGGGRTRIVPVAKGRPLVGASGPAWSPDGRTIAFVGVHRRRGGGYGYHLYTVSENGRDFSRLPGGGYPFDPAWSPDGTWISFSTGGRGISLIRPDGSARIHLDRIPRDACCLAWNPEP